ncbi:MAG: hypothetical protein KJ600_06740 [Nanoarchaeota archaeon]|nr:hypothetical protein [Nanoarchaeota archaeon]
MERGDIYWRPSRGDVDGFLEDAEERTMVIAQTDRETGEVQGYTVLRKTRKTPKSERSPSYSSLNFFYKLLLKRDRLLKSAKTLISSYDEYSDKDELEKLAKRYNLRYKFVPVSDNMKDKRRKKSKLEEAVATVALIALSLSIITSSQGVTGFTY